MTMFSRYDVYTTVQSIYCYPDTDVLKNRLNIHDRDELKQAEEEFSAVRQLTLLRQPLQGRFTKSHLRRIHRFCSRIFTPLPDISAGSRSARVTHSFIRPI